MFKAIITANIRGVYKMTYTLKQYLKDAETIKGDILKTISKYFLEGTGVDIYSQGQALLIEAGNNIVNWRRLLK